MTNYHINQKTQRVNICHAKTVESCPLKNDDGTPSAHYLNKQDAAQSLEKENAQKYANKNSSQVSKSSITRLITINEDDNRILTQRMIDENKTMIRNLPLEQENALRAYTYFNSGEINALLNGNTTRKGRDIDVEMTQKIIERIDKVMDTYGNGAGVEPKKLYRYLRFDKKMNTQEYIDKHFSGGEYTDKGYMSTTEDVSMIGGYARKFSKHENYILLEITTNKGISLQMEDERVGDLLSFEKERLLPRDMSFSVDNMSKASVKIDPSRTKLLQEFGGYGYSGDYVPRISARTFDMISLTDKTF